MKTLTLLLLAALALPAQTPGTITVTSTVNAVAGTGPTAVACMVSNPARPSVKVVCSIGGTPSLTMDVTPAVGATNGAVGSLTSGGNAVTWMIQQPTGGVVSWQIAANGTSQSGTF